METSPSFPDSAPAYLGLKGCSWVCEWESAVGIECAVTETICAARPEFKRFDEVIDSVTCGLCLTT
jgi:hypothetical protein